MKIPTQLKIGGHTYQVVLTKDNSLLEGATACMSDQQGTIWLDARAPRTIQESSLIHEIFHAMATTLDEHPFGHALLDALSEQFYQVIKDNKLI